MGNWQGSSISTALPPIDHVGQHNGKFYFGSSLNLQA